MSGESNSGLGGGIGLLGALFLVLLTLKLLGKISVSWWVVTSPLWGGIALWAAFMGILLIITILLATRGPKL